MNLMMPLEVKLDFNNGTITPCNKKVKRYLSDMAEMYQDRLIAKRMVKENNPLLYEVYEVIVPNEEGQLLCGSSVLYPGKVGREYFMTKGHFHRNENTAEIYFCLKGEGYLLMQTKEGNISHQRMVPGRVAYAPPFWAHRTVNTGKEKFICFYVVPADAEHNYESIVKDWFREIVIEEKGKATIKNFWKEKRSYDRL